MWWLFSVPRRRWSGAPVEGLRSRGLLHPGRRTASWRSSWDADATKREKPAPEVQTHTPEEENITCYVNGSVRSGSESSDQILCAVSWAEIMWAAVSVCVQQRELCITAWTHCYNEVTSQLTWIYRLSHDRLNSSDTSESQQNIKEVISWHFQLKALGPLIQESQGTLQSEGTMSSLRHNGVWTVKSFVGEERSCAGWISRLIS